MRLKSPNKKILSFMLTAHALSLKDTVKSFKNGSTYFIPDEKIADITTIIVKWLLFKDLESITASYKDRGRSCWMAKRS